MIAGNQSIPWHQAQAGDAPLKQFDVGPGLGLSHRLDRNIKMMLRLSVRRFVILLIRFQLETLY
jgi:hypothetical protein